MASCLTRPVATRGLAQGAAAGQPALRATPQRPGWVSARRAALQRCSAAADDSEVAVFRFTLGNNDADALVPRIVGGVGATGLIVNHLLGGQPSDAQLRAELLGAALAAVAAVTPTIEQRLKELQPGRGRQAAASSVAGASSVFALQPGMTEATKQELAWASYALLLNTNICGLAVFWDGRAVLARGLLAVPSAVPVAAGGKSDPAGVLAALSSGASGLQQVIAAGAPSYCPDRAAVTKAGAAAWAGVPEGVESVLAHPLLPLGTDGLDAGGAGSKQGLLLLMSERPRALSGKERAWAAAIAAKLHSALSLS